MTSALRIYEEGLRCGLAAPSHRARFRDGTAVALPLERYLGPADDTDERLLEDVRGPVLDVGCGPGRHLRALVARGVYALGVDLSPVAVELAVGGGCRAIVADIFEELPGAGWWRSALLLDGNIGIGGAPERLLRRIGALLCDGGEVLAELDPPGASTQRTLARIECGDASSGWFPWARVAASAIGPIACTAGFEIEQVWQLSGRWFARLRLRVRERERGHTAPPAAAPRLSAGSVP
jgi:SAM-dependent methyltransferase